MNQSNYRKFRLCKKRSNQIRIN